MSNGKRYRLVEVRPDRGREEVRPIAMSYEEALESLAAERYLHELTGWNVTSGDDLIVCSKGSARRIVQIREFDPMSDLRSEI